METTTHADLLYGVPAIAKYLQLTTAQVYHLSSSGTIPTFKIAAKVCARRSSLQAWLVEQEAKANG